MITSEMVYWITRLDNILLFFGLAGVFLGITSIIMVSIDVDFNIKRIVLGLLLTIICFIACVLIPTTKQMCAILIIPKMANSETIKELGTDSLQIKNLAISYIKEKMEVKK